MAARFWQQVHYFDGSLPSKFDNYIFYNFDMIDITSSKLTLEIKFGQWE